MTELKYIVEDNDQELSLKGLLRNKFDFSSRFMSKIKYNDLVKVNNEFMPLWQKPHIGDEISVSLPDERSNFPAEPIPIKPVFEDDYLLIINKQPGVIVHPTKGHPLHTIANGLMTYMEDTHQSFKIRFVNRLDMDTSGLLIIGKNAFCQNDLTNQMKKGLIQKEYKAIVVGNLENDNGTIDLPIGRPDPEKVQRGVLPIDEGGYASVTHYKVIKRFGNKYTLVQLKLETGRTHQIRVHMSHIGHPVLGDYLYGGDNVNLIERQALHAFQLTFNHPLTHQLITVEAPLPKDILAAIKKIENNL